MLSWDFTLLVYAVPWKTLSSRTPLSKSFLTLSASSLTLPLLLLPLLLFYVGLRGKAIAVITGGIAEMFVSRSTESLTCLRKGFAKIALRVRSTKLDVYCHYYGEP